MLSFTENVYNSIVALSLDEKCDGMIDYNIIVNILENYRWK